MAANSAASGFRQKTVWCPSIRGDAQHRMAYTEWGDPQNPRVLICAHGLTRTGRDFDVLAQTLAPHYRVVCPDVVGRGISDHLKHAQDYGNPQYVADMLTLIARLDVPEVHWLGTSMGGRIGMAVAALENSPVKRLLLNDIGPVMTKQGLLHIVNYLGSDPDFASFDEAVAYVRAVSPGFGEHSDAEWRQLTEHCVMQRDDGRWQFRYDPRIAPFAAKSPRQLAMLRRMARLRLAMMGEEHPLLNQWPIYDAIRCPTLVMRGVDSSLFERHVWLAMGERGPRAKLVEVPGFGHAPTFLDSRTIDIATEFFLAA